MPTPDGANLALSQRLVVMVCEREAIRRLLRHTVTKESREAFAMTGLLDMKLC